MSTNRSPSEKHLREVSFAKHVATLGKRGNIERLRWAAPGTGIFSVTYLLDRHTLIVYGDLDEAVYSWSSTVDLKWISECDLHYFSGKLRASPLGREARVWDSDQAKQRLDSLIEDKAKNLLELTGMNNNANSLAFCVSVVKKMRSAVELKRWCDRLRIPYNEALWYIPLNVRVDPYEYLDMAHEWSGFLEDEGHEFFGEDYYEYYRIGYVLAPFLEAHLIGLKMAFEQLKKHTL